MKVVKGWGSYTPAQSLVVWNGSLAEAQWDELLHLIAIAHEAIVEGDLLIVSLIVHDFHAGCLVKLDGDRDVLGPLSVELTDGLSCIIIVEGFLVATVSEAILFEVANEPLLQAPVLI